MVLGVVVGVTLGVTLGVGVGGTTVGVAPITGVTIRSNPTIINSFFMVVSFRG